MRPIHKSTRYKPNTDEPLEYKEYGDAKPDLIHELGSFCSFCERALSRPALEVEHIRAKSLAKYAHLINRWDNFLLGCKNCNPVKGSKDIEVLLPYLPHEDNLLCFIEVGNAGTINIKKGLNATDNDRTQAFVDLVGLDRNPAHSKYSTKDDRWEKRLEIYDIAERQLNKYAQNSQNFDLETMLVLAKQTGFFSVWFTVFEKHIEVRQALVEAFKGTARDCFDANYNPKPRNTNDI